MVNGNPDPTALAKNSVAATSITRLRPNRSAMGPAANAPTALPSSASDTETPLIQVPIANCSRSATTAPFMTAVSKPKRNPPSAAIIENPTTRRTAPGGTVKRGGGVEFTVMGVHPFDVSQPVELKSRATH